MELEAAIAWPFAMGGAIAERYEWLTDGMPPAYGMETTHRLRQDPRVLLTFDGLETAGARRWMEHLVAMHGAGRWHVPLACDAVETTAAAAADATVVGADTVHRRFVAGGNAMLVMPGQPRLAEMVRIEEVQADALFLETPLLRDWPAGSLLMPTLGCWLDGAPQFSRFTGDDAPYSVAFRAGETMPLAAPESVPSFRDLPVFEQPVYWTQDPGYTPARRVATLDDGIGPILLHDQAGMVLPRITVEVTAVGAAEIGAHRSLLAALSGRHHPVWVPSFAQDFRLLAAPSSTTLDVEWFGFGDWPLQANRRDIRIERHGAAPLYRRITAVNPVTDGERLVLDAALPGGFSVDQVACISFMALCRQDADVNALRLWGQGVVQSQLTFVGCQHGL